MFADDILKFLFFLLIGLVNNNILTYLYGKLRDTHIKLSAWPEVRGTADTDGGAYSPFRSILLVLTHDFIIIQLYADRRAETDRMVITTRIAVADHFICRLRRRESCILGATSSQPTLPLHELPPAKLVIHRQTSNHERRKGTLSVQSRSGILADFCPRQH